MRYLALHERQCGDPPQGLKEAQNNPPGLNRGAEVRWISFRLEMLGLTTKAFLLAVGVLLILPIILMCGAQTDFGVYLGDRISYLEERHDDIMKRRGLKA